MKKLLSTALALILATTMFTACAPSDNDTPDDATITRYTTEGKETKLVPDETATGELTISSLDVDYGEYAKTSMILAIEKYKELYPNVKVNFERIEFTTNDEYYALSKKLQTEVMSDEGPDILWAMDGMDVFKMAKSGKIADMTEFFKNDKNFNVSDYNETVLYSGQVNGKQYLLPTRYGVSSVLTTQDNIDKKMINIKSMNDYFSATKELADIINKSKEENGIPYTLLGKENLAEYFKISGMEVANYLQSNSNIHTDEIKSVVTLCKSVDEIQSSSGTGTFSGGNDESAKKIMNDFAVGHLFGSFGFYEMLTDASYISKSEEPVIIPYKNIRGHQTASVVDVALVNNECKNKQNAYNFLKVYTSSEIQGYTDILGVNVGRNIMIPISNKAVDMLFDSLRSAGAFETLEFGGLSQEFIDSYKSIIEDIDYVSYATPADKIFTEEIQLYFEEKVDIDTCLKSLQDKLEIYISE